ncbi:MAG: tetratricopeptide repeat protein [Terrimicrobiaceae bacterium]
MKIRFVVLSAVWAVSALGQSPPGEPEVRRALPVNRVEPEDYENPPWVTRVLPAEAVSPTPTPTPEAIPVATPFRPPPRVEGAPTPMPTPPPDEAGSIRIAPSSPGDSARAKLDLANSLYSRKMYDLAVPEYELYLISGVRDSRDSALFRVAECHRMLGNTAAARAGYEKLVMEFQTGEFAGAGAYRLGEVLFGLRLYDAACLQFETASREAKDSEVRLTAKYFAARGYDYLQRQEEAAKTYREVAESEGKNPYREHALMALAEIDVRAGRKDEGLAAFEKIASSKSDLASEGAVKAAALAAELGQREKALALFDRVAKSGDAPDWKPVALIGAMRLRYQGNDYRGVIAMGAESVNVMPADVRAEALQLLAASYRQIGNNLEARRTYDRILKEYPDATPAADARLQRLISLYALNEKTLVSEIDAFLENSTDPKARTQATLLKAETLYKQGDFASAGKLYDSLISKDLDPALLADVLYKLGWCLSATENSPAAVTVFTDFLKRYPSHALAASALARRALAHQQGKAFDAALADFDLLIEKYPGTTEHELALQQKALIHGQTKNYAAMKADFSALLEKFPKTTAAAQAHFWLGWAAFEEKDFHGAIGQLEQARKLDAAQYGERASLRIILSYYCLQDRTSLATEAANYKGGNLPAEISLWLAAKFFDEGNFARAEALLAPLVANPAAVPPDAWIQLAESRIQLAKFQDARLPVEKYLESARDPASRARGLLVKARIEAAGKNFEAATALVDEALLLQPEGRLNAEARMASGDLLISKSDYDGAARAFMTVSLLIDDPAITPRALQKAADAYRRAKNPFEAERALTELRERFPDFQKSAKVPRDQS